MAAAYRQAAIAAVGIGSTSGDLVGVLHPYLCPREPGGSMRFMAGLSTPTGEILKPIIEPQWGFRSRADRQDASRQRANLSVPCP